MGRIVRSLLLLLILMSYWHLSSFVLINELYYDHPGSDTGYEWIELFNMGDYPINLENWLLQSAGDQFATIYILPEIIIEGRGYILIGESDVDNADLYADLNFQNGDGVTDGVRIVSLDSLWTDTVLYDNPNINGLYDDTFLPGISFAPDVSAGSSLGRYPDGLDTNSGEDWRERKNPTPGSRNEGELDLCFLHSEILEYSEEYYLYTIVRNVSTEGVDNSAGSIDIYLNNQPLSSFQIGGVSSLQEMEYEIPLSIYEAGYYVTQINIMSLYDNNLDNNSDGASILTGKSDILFNELMIRPVQNQSEWSEVIVSKSVDNYVNNLLIIDETGINHTFNIAGLEPGIYVLGSDQTSLNLEYDIPLDQIIVTEGFPALNNNGDRLFICDEWGTVFDEIEYTGVEMGEFGRSLERINISDENSEWGICEAEAGHTAGYENSIAAVQKDLCLIFKKIISDDTGVYHTLLILNEGIGEINSCELDVLQKDIWKDEECSFQEYISWTGNSTEIVLQSNILEDGFYSFNYTLSAFEDSLTANNSVKSYLNIESLGWVVNEIMYYPESGEPEWIEIKRNLPSAETDELIIVAGEDSSNCAGINEYFLITRTEEDREYLKLRYGADLEIFTGLGSLNNEGEYLKIIDIYGNKFEEFIYEPGWNYSLQNVSIERINPRLPATANNWGKSMHGCTPGNKNSIFIENTPEKKELEVFPRVFSPSLGQSTLISYRSNINNNVIDLSIFDLKGRKIKHLVENEYCSMEHSVAWDGRDKRAMLVRPGVYVILLECFNGSEYFKFKETVTVSW